METIVVNHETTGLGRAVLGGKSTEALAGAVAVVLGILGLAQIDQSMMMAVASIIIGGALILEGLAVAAEYSGLLSRNGNGAIKGVVLGGGVNTQIGGGATAVVLGILALLHLDSTTLMAVAVIVLGASLVFACIASSRLETLKIDTSGDQDFAKRVARDAQAAASGTVLLVGLGVAVLGILALLDIEAMTLILVAVVALGASVLLTGSSAVTRMTSIFST